MEHVGVLELTITGDVPSKKNLYRLGNGRMYTPKEVTEWMDDFAWQVKVQLPQHKPWVGPLSISADFYSVEDHDIDNLQNGLFDALQHAQVIKNDRQIVHVKNIHKWIAGDLGVDPKVQVTITRL